MGKVVVVVSFDEPPPDAGGYAVSKEMIERLRKDFGDKPGVMLHTAVCESADEILAVFKERV